MSSPPDVVQRVVSAGSPEERALGDAVMWKVSLRLIPFIFFLYVMNILDRVNIGFASLRMQEDLDMTDQVFAMGAGIFFIGYFIFEVPSNLILRRVGARRWIGRILISWGIISSATMFVQDAWSFYAIRFLLGLAEAGFFPGIILYLSYWFPARQRARAVARFMTGSAVTGILGNPISGAILQYMDGEWGLHGWQWIFLLEGLPSIGLGFVALLYLTDRPQRAHWLTAPERDWLAQRMMQEEGHREERHGFTLLQAMRSGPVLVLCMVYFTVSMGSNSYGFYAPKIIEHHFTTFGGTDAGLLAVTPALAAFFPISRMEGFEIGLLAAVPSLVAIVSMVLVAMHSDATGERRWHVAMAAFAAAVGWLMVATVESRYLVLLGLAIAHAGMLSMLAPFWSLPTSFLSGAAAAGGIAMINSVGNLGGFFGPNTIGQIKGATGSYSGGLMVLGAAMFVGGFLAILARHDPGAEQKY